MHYLLALMLVLCPFIAQAATTCVQQTAGELTAKLAWQNNDPVSTDTVNVLRSNSTGSETVLTTIPYQSSFIDTVPPVTASSITYYYEVQAKGPGGISAPSVEVCKTFFQGPPAPSNLTVQ